MFIGLKTFAGRNILSAYDSDFAISIKLNALIAFKPLHVKPGRLRRPPAERLAYFCVGGRAAVVISFIFAQKSKHGQPFVRNAFCHDDDPFLPWDKLYPNICAKYSADVSTGAFAEHGCARQKHRCVQYRERAKHYTRTSAEARPVLPAAQCSRASSPRADSAAGTPRGPCTMHNSSASGGRRSWLLLFNCLDIGDVLIGAHR